MSRSLLVLMGLIGCGVAHAEDVKIVIEAEHYGMLVPHMAKVEDATASGGWCVAAPHRGIAVNTPGVDSDPSCASFRIRVPVDGAYRLWARCFWAGGCMNSFWLRIGGQPRTVLGNNGTYQRWHWVKGPRVDLTAGEHVITFRYREQRCKLDQFMLVNNMTYIPVRQMTETPGYLVSSAGR